MCVWDNFIRELASVVRVMKAVGDFYDGFLNNDEESGQDQSLCAESSIRKLKSPCMSG